MQKVDEDLCEGRFDILRFARARKRGLCIGLALCRIRRRFALHGAAWDVAWQPEVLISHELNSAQSCIC